ncbi:MAG TPA: hypothetical protein VH418_14045 [Solirubrobacteraceae bacterium]|jgi:hypothetical protein
MEEIRDGVFHWTAYRDTIRQDVHSHFHAPSGTLFDPMEPPEGLGPFEPRRIVLSNRHHWRRSDRFGVPVLCHEAGLHEFADGREVRGFKWGDELAPGVVAHEVGVLCPEETALGIDGALLFADSVIRGRDGELAFVPDFLLGDDPQAVREGLRAAFIRLCDEVEFDALLMAHGAPVATGGRSLLRRFAEAG